MGRASKNPNKMIYQFHIDREIKQKAAPAAKQSQRTLPELIEFLLKNYVAKSYEE